MTPLTTEVSDHELALAILAVPADDRTDPYKIAYALLAQYEIRHRQLA